MDVEADLAIRSLLARLAHLADEGDVDGYLALFTGDAVWEMPANPQTGLAGSRRQGRDQLAAGVVERTAAGLQGPGSRTMHVLTTVAVEAPGGDEATAASSFLYCSTGSTPPTILSMGVYHDAFRRTADGWRLAHRTILFP